MPKGNKGQKKNIRIKKQPNGYYKTLTCEEVLDDMYQVAQRFAPEGREGIRLMAEQYRAYGNFSISLVLKWFHTWNNALRQAQLCPQSRTNYIDSKYFKPTTLKLRVQVFQRDKFRCVYCGASPSDGVTRLHCDHRIPRIAGGLTCLDNLQTLCEACNLGKGAQLEG